MNKWNIKLLVCLGFITSGVISFLAYNEDGLELSLSVGIWISTILILESCKGISFFNYVRAKSKSWLILWLSLMFISMVGNMCFLSIGAIKNENNKLVFEDVKSKKASLEEQIAYKKADKTKKETEKNNINSSINKDKEENNNKFNNLNLEANQLQSKLDAKNKELKDAVKKKYAKTPDIIKKEISTITNNLNKKIVARDNLKGTDTSAIVSADNKLNEIDSEINILQSQANAISISDASPTKKGAGIETLFDYLGIEWKFTKFLMLLFISFIFELSICAFYLNSKDLRLRDIKKPSTPLGSKNPSENNPENTQVNNPTPKRILHYKISPKPKITNEYTQAQSTTQDNTIQYGTSDIITTNTNPIHIETKKIIGFKKEVEAPKEVKKLLNEHVLAYLDVMYDTAINNECIGYKKIGKMVTAKGKVKITDSKAKNIHGFLCEYGAIKIINGTTTIIKTKEEIKL